MSDRLAQLLRMGGHFARARWAFTHLRGANLSAYHDRRAQQMVRFAMTHSPFYRAHWANHNPADWRGLPTVDKRFMMENFDEFNTQGLQLEKAMASALQAEASRDFAPTIGDGLTVGLSSGTSGHRGVFLVSAAETAAWAGTILARTLTGLPSRGYRIALFLRSNSNLYERLGQSGRIVFRWFDLMMEPHAAVESLAAFAPHLLVGPPSLLLLLAQAKKAAGSPLRITPEQLLSVAEVLEQQDKARLETAFQVPVGQIYQCTEGLLAVTCEHGRLHLQEDLAAVQCEPLSPNDPNRVTPIVTDLWRRVQPIVRYRLNDVLRLAPPDAPACLCGSAFRVLDAIEGRCDDTCYFFTADCQSAEKRRPFFPDTIRRMILLADARITEYEAVQPRPGHLHIFLDVTNDAPFAVVANAVRESVHRTVAQYNCLPPIVQIDRGVPPVPPGTKRRRVRCLPEADNEAA